MIIIQLDSEQLNTIIQNAVRKVISEKTQVEQNRYPELDRWFDIDELEHYLKNKKATIYGWVHDDLIPYHKNPGHKKLRFLKSEIDAWLKQGRKKTLDEISREADTFLNKNK